MAKRPDDMGLCRRGRRWWLRLYVSGRGKPHFPLTLEVDRYPTTSKAVARVLAKGIHRRIGATGQAPDAPTNLSESVQ